MPHTVIYTLTSNTSNGGGKFSLGLDESSVAQTGTDAEHEELLKRLRQALLTTMGAALISRDGLPGPGQDPEACMAAIEAANKTIVETTCPGYTSVVRPVGTEGSDE